MTNTNRMYIVRRRKAAGWVWHYGLLLPDGTVIEHSPLGVRRLPAESFAAGEDVETVREVAATQHRKVHARLTRVLEEPHRYDLAEWNCETFANWLAGEEPRSDQVRWIVLLASFCLVAALSNR